MTDRPKKRPPLGERPASGEQSKDSGLRRSSPAYGERRDPHPRRDSEEQVERAPRGLSRDEQKYFGRNACQAIFDTRPEEIIRVYVSEKMKKPFAPLLTYCAKEKRAFHIVTPDDLEKVTSSEHHQGIALIAKKRGSQPFTKCKEPSGCFLYLDGVENPHNFGAILRSCGYFTISGILGIRGELPSLSGTACRTAEGAAEMVSIWEMQGASDLAELKKKGFRIIATSSHAKRSLYGTKLPEDCVVILGSEGGGISPDILALADEEVAIPGAGAVESLNVSAACAVLLGEYVRQRGERKEFAKQAKTADVTKKKEQKQVLVASRNGFHRHPETAAKGGKGKK